MTNGNSRRSRRKNAAPPKQLWTRKSLSIGLVLFASAGFAILELSHHGSQPPELLPDFQMFPSARTFDPPGSIFRINRDGIRYDVADISSEIMRNVGNEAIPDQAGRRRVAGTLIGNLLKGNSSIDVSASGSYDVRLKLSGVVRETTSDLDLDKALSLALKQVALRSNNRYYVIRETIAAREVDYELTTAELESVAAKADAPPMGNGKINVRQDGSTATTLVGHYDTPYRLFYKVEEIQFASSGLNGDLNLSRHPVTETITWREASHTN